MKLKEDIMTSEAGNRAHGRFYLSKNETTCMWDKGKYSINREMLRVPQWGLRNDDPKSANWTLDNFFHAEHLSESERWSGSMDCNSKA